MTFSADRRRRRTAHGSHTLSMASHVSGRMSIGTSSSSRRLYQLLDTAWRATADRPAPISSADAHLSRDRRAGRPHRRRPAGARRQEGHQSRASHAQLPDVHCLLFRHPQGRRHGRQLQPALYARGTDLPGEGQRDRADGHARPQRPVRQGRGAAAGRHPRAGHCRLLRCSAARRPNPSCSSCSRAGSWPAPTSRRCAARSSTMPTCSRDAGSFLQPRDRPAERHRRAAVHRRHHRHAQGRDADPRQRDGQRQQGVAWASNLERRPGAGAGGAAVLPRLRHDRGHELRASSRAPRSS